MGNQVKIGKKQKENYIPLLAQCHGRDLGNIEVQEVLVMPCFVQALFGLFILFFWWSQIMGESNFSLSELVCSISLLLQTSIQKS